MTLECEKLKKSQLEESGSYGFSYEKKIIDPSLIGALSASLKKEGHVVATLNGSFDLLHAGHLYILFSAKKAGDKLIVLLNTDESIKRYKGESRPLISLDNRLKMVAALECVDYVSYFREDDPREILSEIKPNIHVNGAEYGTECIEKEVVILGGGTLHLVDRIAGLTTSEIIKKIQCE